MANLPLKAQTVYKLQVINTDTAAVFKKISYKKQFLDKNFIEKEVNKIYISLIDAGYISASVDSTIQDSLNYRTYIAAGKKYKWVNLNYDKKEQDIVSKLGYNEHFFTKRPFKFSELSKFMEKIIIYYENNGYPFALAKLDSLQFENSNIVAKLHVEKNVFIKLATA